MWYSRNRELYSFLLKQKSVVPKLENFIDLFVNDIDISKFECPEGKSLIQGLSGYLMTYLQEQERPVEVLAKFYRYILQMGYYIPRKEECDKGNSFYQIVMRRNNLDAILPQFFLATIHGLMQDIQNWNFFFALKFHDTRARDDFYDENDKENIDPTDIIESFKPDKFCVITALLYAENEVFGVKEPKQLHDILVTYFSNHSNSEDEPLPNIPQCHTKP